MATRWRSGGRHRVGALAGARLDDDRGELADERPRLHRAGRVREERHVEAGVVDVRVVERPEHADGRDHADDRAPRAGLPAVAPPRVRKRRPSALSVAEVLLREGGVDDRHRLARVEIVVGEGAAFEQPLAGDLEEAAA